jgi:uncharacterized protein with HEPN domain
MPRDKDTVRLHHMLDAAREAVSHAAGRARADLDTDRQLMHALVRLLEIIGEAASQVPQSTRDKHPQIEWRSMVGMRHRIVHAYFHVDLNVVWKAVQEDLPPLIAQLARVLGEEDPG